MSHPPVTSMGIKSGVETFGISGSGASLYVQEAERLNIDLFAVFSSTDEDELSRQLQYLLCVQGNMDYLQYVRSNIGDTNAVDVVMVSTFLDFKRHQSEENVFVSELLGLFVGNGYVPAEVPPMMEYGNVPEGLFN